MRVLLFVSNVHQAHLTGQQKIGFGLASNLKNNGHMVGIITNNPHYNESKRETILGLNCLVVPGEARTGSFIKNLNKINRYADDFSPDVIHGHGLASAPFTAALGKILKTPTIQTVYEVTGFSPIKKKIFINSLRFIDAVLCTSSFIRECLVTEGPSKMDVRVVYYGIENKWFEEPPPIDYAEETKVLFWGDANLGRGVDTLLETVKRYHKFLAKDIDIKYVFAIRFSDEEYAKKLENFADEYPVNSIGVVEDVRKVVYASDVIVLPYNQTTIQPPLTLVESMISGGCVITTNVDSNREFILGSHQRGLLVKPEDPVQLGRSLCLLKDNPELRRILSENAKSFIEKGYNWNTVLDDVLETYTDVISRS